MTIHSANPEGVHIFSCWQDVRSPSSYTQVDGNITLTHWTAHLTREGGALSLQRIPHPTPGPNEILVEVKAIAFNHIDYKQRDGGLNVTRYPTVLGSDVAGLVKQVGPVVWNRRQAEPLAIGTRVLAFASAFYKDNDWSMEPFKT